MTILIDAAGASMGGARRYLEQLDVYLREQPRDVDVIGRDRAISIRWLVERERILRSSSPRRVIAINNMCTVGGEHRTVLLRNALHFLRPDEQRDLGAHLSRRTMLAGRISRRLALRADSVIVPSNAMKSRVEEYLPSLGGRLTVLMHPLAAPEAISRPISDDESYRVLCPLLDSPFKRLDLSLPSIVEAIAMLQPTLDRPLELRLSLNSDELANCVGQRWPGFVQALGRRTPAEIDVEFAQSDAILFPSKIESFGYPLAEARIRGLPVLSYDTELAGQIAGPSFIPTDFSSSDDVASGLLKALLGKFAKPRTNPFEPGAYFRALLAES